MSTAIQLSQLVRGQKARLTHHVQVNNETKGHKVRAINTTAITVKEIRVVDGANHYVCMADSQQYTNDTLVFETPDDVMVVML